MIQTPTKASFTCVDDRARSIAAVSFNPASLVVGREVVWSPNPAKQVAWAGLSFDHGKNDTLSMQLLLDESEGATFGTPNTISVLVAAKRFHALTLPVTLPTGNRPPVVIFSWEQLRFQGVVTRVSVDFTLFSASGTPKRAMVTVDMTGQAFQTGATAEAVLSPTYTPTGGGAAGGASGSTGGGTTYSGSGETGP